MYYANLYLCASGKTIAGGYGELLSFPLEKVLYIVSVEFRRWEEPANTVPGYTTVTFGVAASVFFVAWGEQSHKA